MNPVDVLNVLRQRGIDLLYHANSVTTSCTFLREGALVSRGYAEDRRLPQTDQYTDQKDKEYGVWHDVFVDSDDYHRRIRDRNMYGPVVFVLGSQVLVSLPAGSQVMVTRYNPSKWDGVPVADRYFRTLEELRQIGKGTFDHMVTARTAGHSMPFTGSLVEIRLDNPQEKKDGVDQFDISLRTLQAAANDGRIQVPIVQQTCRDGCRCVATYAGDPNWVRKNF